MRVGVVGGGVVGHATARSYIEHVEEVRVYDIVKEKATHCLGFVLACDIVFVCLPTPQKKDSLECDTTCVEDFLASLPDDCLTQNYVLRSTVPIGFTKKMREKYSLPNLVHSPEFLTARCAVNDAQLPARNIIGGYGNKDESLRPQIDAETNDYPCHTLLEKLYQSRYPHVPIHCMTSDESEAVKLFQNSFFAVKIAFFNECNQLAKKLGLDWQAVMNAILADGRISPSHTKVPGPDGLRGFGGTCLPKDLASLVTQMTMAGMGGYKTNGRLLTHTALMNNIEDRKRT